MNRESNLLEGSEMVQYHRATSKDLPEVGVKLFEPSGSWFEGNKLNNALEERYSLLKEPRIEKDSVLSVAKWDPGKKKVVVVKKRGKEFETFGHHDSVDNLDYLNAEEALFLVESNSLVLQHGNREVSVEICYSLLLNEESGCDLQQYRIFSHLSRLGYKLIRHKKPRRNDLIVDDSSRPVEVNGSRVNESNRGVEDVVLIDDSSSDSSNDDVVILDVSMKANEKEVIDIMDDDSCDSDIVLVETPGLVELPLENWSYIHRSKFLSTTDNEIRQPSCLDVFIVSQPEYEILNEIPNIKSRKNWLFRPDERLVPDGVWPFHMKYLIDLNQEKNEFNRGRGGYRGRGFRGRGWYLQRQVYQMKNYTMSLMNMVSQMMGTTGVHVIPPPPCLFQGQYNRFQRGANRQTWGRISFNRQGMNHNSNGVTEIVELSDEEDSLKRVKSEQDDDEDVKPKRIKLESDECLDNSSLVKLEPSDIKREIKTETDRQTDVPGLNNNVTVKSENTQVKSEIDENITDSSHVDNVISNSSSINMEVSSENLCTISCISSESCDDSVDISSKPEEMNGTSNQPEVSCVISRCEENVFGYAESVGDSGTENQTDDSISVTGNQTTDAQNDKLENCETIDVDEIPDKPVNTSCRVTNKTCSIVNTCEVDENSMVVLGESCESVNDKENHVNNVDNRNNSFVDDDVIMLDVSTNVSSKEENETGDGKVVRSTHEEVKDHVQRVPSRSDKPVESVSSRTEEAAEIIHCKVVKCVKDVSNKSQETVENILCISEESVESVSDVPVNNLPLKSKEPVKNISSKSQVVKNLSRRSEEAVENLPDRGHESYDSISCISEESVEIVPCSDEPLKTVPGKSKSPVKHLPSGPQCLVKSVSHRSDEPMLIDDDSEDVSVMNTDNSNKLSEHIISCETSKNIESADDSNKQTNWKGFKEMEKEASAQVNERILPSHDSDEDSCEYIDVETSLIQPVHCSSIGSILKRLQIFKQYESPSVLNNVKDIKVTYDIYLPQRPYYRNLPPQPDFRLVILRLEDNFPNADEMTQLKNIYNDKVNFLFAVALKESIAYYLYDNVFLPVDDSSL